MTYVIALCSLACFFIVGVFLFHSGKFSGAGFNVYIGIILLACMAFYGFDRLKELDLKNLRIVLSEIRETKRDIFAKADSVKHMGENIAELVAYNFAWSNRLVGDDHVDNLVASRKKVFSLLDELDSESQRRDEILGQIDEFVIRDLAGETVEAAQKCTGVKLTPQSRTALREALQQKASQASLEELSDMLEEYGARCAEAERSIARLHEFASVRQLSKPKN